ncbi:MAG: 3-isopropylmalate dehydratase small subunit [Pseudohongiella sp.]|nr:3-isopropylmalate dehydratase small subunit [Pseudohongiella sp.]
MKAFVRHSGIVAPFVRENIDTDLITPLNRQGSGLSGGDIIFDSIRYLSDGSENPDFILNQEPYRNASILLTGKNFGTGSSRESAVTGMMAFGFKCVIAPSFGAIFYNNCFANGMLPIVLEEHVIAYMEKIVSIKPASMMDVDLEKNTISHPLMSDPIVFNTDSRMRNKLLLGLDDIDEIMSHSHDETTFQNNDRAIRPWVYDWQ